MITYFFKCSLALVLTIEIIAGGNFYFWHTAEGLLLSPSLHSEYFLALLSAYLPDVSTSKATLDNLYVDTSKVKLKMFVKKEFHPKNPIKTVLSTKTVLSIVPVFSSTLYL